MEQFNTNILDELITDAMESQELQDWFEEAKVDLEADEPVEVEHLQDKVSELAESYTPIYYLDLTGALAGYHNELDDISDDYGIVHNGDTMEWTRTCSYYYLKRDIEERLGEWLEEANEEWLSEHDID